MHLETDPNQHKKLMANLTRKITVLRVNEKSLSRRYTILQEVEKALRKENGKIRKDMMDIEASVTKKIGYLERHKVMILFNISFCKIISSSSSRKGTRL